MRQTSRSGSCPYGQAANDQTVKLSCVTAPNVGLIERTVFTRMAAFRARQGFVALEDIRSYLSSDSTVRDVFTGFEANHDGQVTLLEIFPPGGPPTTPELFGNLFTQAQAEMALAVANKYLDMLPEIRLSQMNSQTVCANRDDNDHKTSCPISLNRIKLQSAQTQNDDEGGEGDHNDQ